jgi:PAS domain S-box-containing protein
MHPCCKIKAMEPDKKPSCPHTALREAEEALRRNQRRFAAFMENLPGTAFMKDQAGRYLYVNKQFAEVFGCRPEDMVGKTFFDLAPESLARSLREADESALAGNKPVETLFTFPASSGPRRWLAVRFPIQEAEGEAPILGGVGLDVTKYKQAEDDLRQSEERFRLTFENAVDAIFWADPATGTLINCNKAAEELLQRPRKEIIGKHQTFIHPPEKASYYQGRFARDAREGKLSSGDGEVVTSSGRIVPVHMAASLTTVGTEPILQGVFRDMTALNQAWEAVRISQQRLQMVVSNAPVVLLLADTDGVIRFADGRALASLAFTGEQLVGQNILNVYHDAQAMGQSMRIALAGQDSASVCEVAGRIFNMRLSPLRDDKGGITGVVGVAVDITARHKAEAALDAARLKLLAVREEEQKRVAGELHDSIGQQLVAMKIAFASAGLAEQAHKCAELIRETRRLCYNLYPPSLEALGLASALSQLGRHCEQAVCLDVKCPPEIESARFDPEKEIALFRVAQEAVNNAIRHGKAKTIQLSLAHRDGRLEMTIADDGSGFDPAAQAGKGLGLQTMADRIRAVGGTIGIDSCPGRTTIEVRVPLDPAADGDPGAG